MRKFLLVLILCAISIIGYGATKQLYFARPTNWSNLTSNNKKLLLKQNSFPMQPISSVKAHPTTGIDIRNSSWVASFDGSDDYGQLDGPFPYLPAGSSARTLQFWVLDNTLNTTTDYCWFSYGVANTGTAFSALRGYTTTTNSNGIALDLNAQRIYSTLTRQNRWIHIAITYKDGGTLNDVRFYVNGELQSMSSGSDVANTNVGASAKLFIAKYWSYHTPKRMDICELSIWDDEWTQQDIQENMNTLWTGREPNIKSLWHCNEGSGNILYNSVSGAGNITLSGATWDARSIP